MAPTSEPAPGSDEQNDATFGSFTLPNTVDAEKVQANYEKGILKIQLSKKAEAKPKQIKVNVGSEKALEGKGARAA